MKMSELREFAVEQIAWYEKDIERLNRWIRDETKDLAASRKFDRDLAASILADETKPDVLKDAFRGNFVSFATKKHLADRNRLYRERQHERRMIEKYTADIQRYDEFIRKYGNI